MRVRFLLSLVIVVSFVLAACSGEDGAVGPAGSDGTDGFPAPMKILLAASDNSISNRDNVMAGLIEFGGLTLGSTITHITIADSVPPVSVLSQFDAVLVWTNSVPQYPDSFGDVLADYVDAGGPVVVTTFANSDNWVISGRFQDPGYSPWVNGPRELDGTSPRTIDFNSIAQPPHKIFNGTDIRNITFWSNASATNPAVEGTATLLAMDTGGWNAVAINANGRVIGLNMYPPQQYTNSHNNTLRLIGNALRCTAGNY